MPNLTSNIESNRGIIAEHGGTATAGVLDWSDTAGRVAISGAGREEEKETARYDVILAADPLYSPRHPELLVNTILRWLRRGGEARVVVEVPLREAYMGEVEEMKRRMRERGLALREDGEETGFDDWGGGEGEMTEVRCWWGVWGWGDVQGADGIVEARHEDT